MSLHLFNPFDPLASTSLETSSVILHLKTKFGMDEVTLKSLTETDGTLFLSPKLIPPDQTQVQISAEICSKSRPIIPAKPSLPPITRPNVIRKSILPKKDATDMSLPPTPPVNQVSRPMIPTSSNISLLSQHRVFSKPFLSKELLPSK